MRLLQRHRKLAIVGAVLGLVVGSVASLPASLLANAVASATSDQFLLAEAEGTVWNGSAITVLTGGAGSHDASVLPTRLEWTLRPHWNGVSLHLTQDCCLAHGIDLSLRRTLDAWQVDVIGPDERGKPAARADKVTPGAERRRRRGAGRRHAAGPVADGLARGPRLSVEHDPSGRRADAEHAQSVVRAQGRPLEHTGQRAGRDPPGLVAPDHARLARAPTAC